MHDLFFIISLFILRHVIDQEREPTSIATCNYTRLLNSTIKYLISKLGIRSILFYFFIYFNFVIVLQCVSLIPPLMLDISFTCFFVYCRDLSSNNIQNLAENAFSGLVNLDEL